MTKAPIRVKEETNSWKCGLGRLAACFVDSLANGYQRERPDRWLAAGAPWLIAGPEEACMVPIYGRIVHDVDRRGGYNPMWMEWRTLVGLPYDMPIAGIAGRACRSATWRAWGNSPGIRQRDLEYPEYLGGLGRFSPSVPGWGFLGYNRLHEEDPPCPTAVDFCKPCPLLPC
jgi:glucan phosphorylase